MTIVPSNYTNKAIQVVNKLWSYYGGGREVSFAERENCIYRSRNIDLDHIRGVGSVVCGHYRQGPSWS